MKAIEKIKTLSKISLNEKDYNLICSFIGIRDFDSVSEIINSEIFKEYKRCSPERMTDRYCNLQEISYILVKYELVTNDVEEKYADE